MTDELEAPDFDDGAPPLEAPVRPQVRAQRRIIATLAVAVVCSVAALTMVLTTRSLEREAGELYTRIDRCAPPPVADSAPEAR